MVDTLLDHSPPFLLCPIRPQFSGSGGEVESWAGVDFPGSSSWFGGYYSYFGEYLRSWMGEGGWFSNWGP
jgi:hypothetical protein